MKRVIVSITQAADRRLEPQGITHAQWGPLFLLRSGRASTVAELARELQTDPGAMTRLLDRLESKGLCRRDPLHRRPPRRQHRAHARGRGRGRQGAGRAVAGAERAPRRLLQGGVDAAEGLSAPHDRERRGGWPGGRRSEPLPRPEAVDAARKAAARTLTTLVIALTSTVLHHPGRLRQHARASRRAPRWSTPAKVGRRPPRPRRPLARRLVARLRRPGADLADRPAVAGSPSLRVVAGAGRAGGGQRRHRPRRRGSAAQRRVRCHAPALHRERHLPAAAGRLHARQRHLAAQRLVGARPVRPQPRRARRGDRRAARRRGRCRGGARSLLAVNVARNYVQLARLIEQREVAAALADAARPGARPDPPARLRRPRHHRRAAPGRGRAARDPPADRSRRRADRAHPPCARRAHCAAARRRSTRWRRGCTAVRAVPLPEQRAGRPARPPRRHRRRALARRGRDRRRRRGAGAVLSEHQPRRLRRPVDASASTGCCRPAAGSTASARRSACRSSTPAGCAPTCAAAPPTSTPRSRATTAASSTRCTTSPTRSARPARSSASSASRPSARRPPPSGLRPRDAALPRRPRHLPDGAERRDQRARRSAASAPTSGPRARHPGRAGARPRRRLRRAAAPCPERARRAFPEIVR